MGGELTAYIFDPLGFAMEGISEKLPEEASGCSRMVKIFKAFESVEPAMMDSLHEN
jgi:hypothetical protein